MWFVPSHLLSGWKNIDNLAKESGVFNCIMQGEHPTTALMSCTCNSYRSHSRPPWLGHLYFPNQIDRNWYGSGHWLCPFIQCSPWESSRSSCWHSMRIIITLPPTPLPPKKYWQWFWTVEHSINKHQPCGFLWDMSVCGRYRQGMSKVKIYSQEAVMVFPLPCQYNIDVNLH